MSRLKILSNSSYLDLTATWLERCEKVLALPIEPIRIPTCDAIYVTFAKSGIPVAKVLESSINISSVMMFANTAFFGRIGEHKQAGMNSAFRSWFPNQKRWYVAGYTPANGGLTVLSTLQEFKPEIPIKAWADTQPLAKIYGAGTRLSQILRTLGYRPKEGCSCIRRQLEMDRNGIEWCKDNIETIVDWMEENYAQSNSLIPFVRIAVKALVQQAIKQTIEYESKKRDTK